jgi:transcription termination factor Rho
MSEPQPAATESPEAEVERPQRVLSDADLHSASMTELIRIARDLKLEDATQLRKRGLIFRILASQADAIRTCGVLEVLGEGFGFLRGAETSYLAGLDDIYVSPSQIERFDLRTGDTIDGLVRAPKDGERYFSLDHINEINHSSPNAVRRKSFYKDLTPLHPEERFCLENGHDDISTRIMDMLCPIGKGQRALIVSPPRAGKTVLLQSIAHSIAANHPEARLLVLLIDERPEEVTDMARTVRGEVIASTFDEPATRHIQVAEMVLEKALRLAEQGHDVVILLDSITRLARAYNTATPASGRVLSGGVDAKALHKPKRFFGAARNIEEGGSLSIVATALIETGSRMDEVIFEEFKGTGNAEIVLDRKLADRRVWPAIDVNRSGTRKEELLLGEDILERVWILRRIMQPLEPAEAMQLLIQRLGQTESNEKFLASLKSSS